MAKSETTLGHTVDMVEKAQRILSKVVEGSEGQPDTPTTSPYAEEIRNRTERCSIQEQMGWDMGSFPKTKKVKMERRGKGYTAPQYTLPMSGGRIEMIKGLNKVLAAAAFEEAYPKGVKTKELEITPKQLADIKRDVADLKPILDRMLGARKDKDHPLFEIPDTV